MDVHTIAIDDLCWQGKKLVAEKQCEKDIRFHGNQWLTGGWLILEYPCRQGFNQVGPPKKLISAAARRLWADSAWHHRQRCKITLEWIWKASAFSTLDVNNSTCAIVIRNLPVQALLGISEKSFIGVIWSQGPRRFQVFRFSLVLPRLKWWKAIRLVY